MFYLYRLSGFVIKYIIYGKTFSVRWRSFLKKKILNSCFIKVMVAMIQSRKFNDSS